MNTVRDIHVVLHGGLGNQLFQLYKACLLADENPMAQVVLHCDLLSQYGSARDFEMQIFVERDVPNAPVVAPMGPVCSLRIPKLIEKLTRLQCVLGFYPGTRIVDGYFQSMTHYRQHMGSLMYERLTDWRDWLRTIGYVQSAQYSQLVHIRLGDFFSSRQQALEYTVELLASVGAGSGIISNDETIVGEAVAELRRHHELYLVPTKEMNAWSVLHAMSAYKRISTNGSTLAFWAATLAGSEFQSSNNRHNELFSMLNT